MATAPRPAPPDPVPSGLAAFQAGRFEEAEALFRQAARAAPKSVHAAYFLGLACAELARFEEADAQISRAIGMGLSDPAAHYHHARALVGLERSREAEAALDRALALKPDFPQALALLGNLHFVRHAHDSAETLYRKALALDSSNRLARRNLAECSFVLGRMDDALEILDSLGRGGGAEAWQDRLAALRLCERGNRLDEAERRAAQLLAVAPTERDLLIVAAKVARRTGRANEAADFLARAEAAGIDDGQGGAALTNERAQLLDSAGRWGEAFAAYAEAKRRQREQQKSGAYDHAGFAARLDAAEQAVRSPAWPGAAGPATTPNAGGPIFVLGFFRTGTTLVEQMLSSHSRIGAAGELTMLERLGDELRPAGRFPEGWAALDAAAREAIVAPLRAAYLELLHKRGGEKPRAVDKHPFNVLRLPLIAALFPGAPAIRMLRHPLDVILSCYFNLFEGGNEWSFSLADAARHLARTHRHVRAVEARVGVRLLEVRYERLIAEPEAQLRALLAWLGEEWDPACLEFHRNRRVVETASYAQVSRPLYSEAVDRWRRYADLIPREAIEALKPMADELEYETP